MTHFSVVNLQTCEHFFGQFLTGIENTNVMTKCRANGDGKIVPEVKHQVMMIYGEMEVKLLLFLHSTRHSWVATSTIMRLGNEILVSIEYLFKFV
jgi:hypothetical protein